MKIAINDNWTDICNKALSKVGLPEISSITADDSESAQRCRSYLPEAVGVCAEYANWSFLKKEARLTRKAVSMPYGSNQSYKNAYDLPSDLARLISARVGEFKYERFGNEIRTDSGSCVVKYISYPELPENLPFYFKTAIEGYLAYLLAVDLNIKSLMASDFNNAILQAKTFDSSDLQSGGNRFWTEDINR